MAEQKHRGPMGGGPRGMMPGEEELERGYEK